jgi:hypothetical protein
MYDAVTETRLVLCYYFSVINAAHATVGLAHGLGSACCESMQFVGVQAELSDGCHDVLMLSC